MIVPIVGHIYKDSRTGMVVVVVVRYPHETNQLRFPGRVLFAGKNSGWATIGRRITNLSPRNFEEVSQYLPVEQVRAGRSA